jgi:hypothetical protein
MLPIDAQQAQASDTAPDINIDEDLERCRDEAFKDWLKSLVNTDDKIALDTALPWQIMLLPQKA